MIPDFARSVRATICRDRESKHVDINETMVRTIARQAEAERIRRAKIIDAEGEYQAAEKLAQAGEILANRQEAMQLRYYTALQAIAGERSSTIVLPIPVELMKKLGAG
jgi:regulator of protease activity HflC (stomatin/prohibitin superfamily)